MRSALRTSVLLVLSAIALPAFAVQPDEPLADPALEARARDLSKQLRCMVCQNQSIDDSDAPLARDLRVLVRERITAGDSNNQVLDYLVSRYGEFVLLQPRFSMQNALLWGTPVVLIGAGAILVFASARGRRARATPLTTAESEQLRELLQRDP